MTSYKAVVIGTSAGGLTALTRVLSPLPGDFPLPIIIVQHLSPDSDDFLIRHLKRSCDLNVKEAEDKDVPRPGWIYVAPPNYHLMVEEERYLSLSVGPPVNFSRPSIDVLFETAADAYTRGLVGIILTGANSDGTRGSQKIRMLKGQVIVQDPETAEADMMPRSVIEKKAADKVLPLDEIGKYLRNLIKDIL